MNYITQKPIGNIYPIAKEYVEDIFEEYILNRYFDAYGNYMGDRKYIDKNGAFISPVFIMRPYYWGDKGYLIQEPNFEYRDKFSIYWYKYPMKGAYAEHPITEKEYIDALNECRNFLESIS